MGCSGGSLIIRRVCDIESAGNLLSNILCFCWAGHNHFLLSDHAPARSLHDRPRSMMIISEKRTQKATHSRRLRLTPRLFVNCRLSGHSLQSRASVSSLPVAILEIEVSVWHLGGRIPITTVLLLCHLWFMFARFCAL